MLKVKKLSIFLTVLAISTLLFAVSAFADTNVTTGAATTTTGAATNINKLNDIKQPLSYDSKMKLKLNINATNLSAKEKEDMAMLLLFMSSIELDIDSKVEANPEKTLISYYTKASTLLMGTPLDMEFWMKYDTTGKEPKYNMVIKMPKGLPILPTDKEYLVIDSSDLEQGTVTPVTGTSQNLSPEVSKQLQNIILQICNELNTKYNLVTDKGIVTIKTPIGDTTANSFEIKLDNKTFKEVLKYMIENLLNNKEFVAIINQQSPEQTLKESELKEAQAEIAEFFNLIKDLKLVGDKGICIRFALNPDNYVVSNSGTIDIIIDTVEFDKLGNAQSGIPAVKSKDAMTGIYNVTLEYDETIYNINKSEKIVFPTLTKDNSQTLMELMETMYPDPSFEDSSEFDFGDFEIDNEEPAKVEVKPATPAKKPATKAPAKKPAVAPAKKPVVAPAKKPATKKPAVAPAKKPATKKPVVAPAKKPTTKKPVVAPAKKPAAPKKPATKKK